MDDKLTRKSQEALSDAVRRATAGGNPHVDPLHLLTALIEQNGGTAAPLLRAIGVDPAIVLKTAGHAFLLDFYDTPDEASIEHLVREFSEGRLGKHA